MHPLLIAALAALPVQAMYAKSSPVLQLNARTYKSLIAESNHTSIVEFYAPWCGHCKNLKPAYEKAAKTLDGLAKVAAIDCDEETNKQFCGSMGVQGFPTLKIVRPGKKGKPVVEDYQGPRTASGIAEALVAKINNHVTRLADKDVDAFLEGEKPKAILFTEKGTTSALIRSIAIDFLDVISVGQVRSKESKVVERFSIDKFPTLVLIQGDDTVMYEGELNKKDMVEFLKRAGEPNPDPAPKAKKAESKAKGDKKVKAEKAKPESKTKDETTKDEKTEADTKDEEATQAKSEPTPAVHPIETITKDTLAQCLLPKAHTCILAIIPSESTAQADKVTESLTALHTKYVQGKRQMFPFLSAPRSVDGVDALRTALGLTHDVDLVAINARRSWWKQYEGDFGPESVESWVDAIRMGEGAKNKLPAGVVAEEKPEEIQHEEL